MKTTLLGLLLMVLGAAAWVRLAPDDPARWHVPVPQGAAKGAHTHLASPAPAEMLARLAAVAEATPRTRRLAGSVDEGRITWVVRSALWGFPDYVTAETVDAGGVQGVNVWSRQRYGSGDAGVNARRLRDWVDRLTGG